MLHGDMRQYACSSGESVHFYVKNMTSNSGNISKFISVESASNALKCMINTSGNKNCTIGSVDQASTKCSSTSHVGAKHCKPRVHGDEQVHWHNAVKKSDDNSNTNLQETWRSLTITYSIAKGFWRCLNILKAFVTDPWFKLGFTELKWALED